MQNVLKLLSTEIVKDNPEMLRDLF